RSTLPGFGRRRAVHLERDGDVLQGRLPRHEGIGLEEIARLAVDAFELGAEDLALAGRWREQARRYVQQCGFATSRRTDDGHELTVAHVQVGVCHGRVALARPIPESDPNVTQ